MTKYKPLDEYYPRVYIKNANEILKPSTIPAKIWEKFVSKDLKNVNSPIEFHEISAYERKIFKRPKNPKSGVKTKSVITVPYLREHNTLEDTELNGFTTTDILYMLKKNLQILQEIHKNGVIHGDINAANIMIDKNLDLELIDFDAMMCDSYISDELRTTIEKGLSDKEIMKVALLSDKRDLLNIFLTYLSTGEFGNEPYYNALKLKDYHNKALDDILDCDNLNPDYYFRDFIDDLISEKYESPVIYAKNLMSKGRK